MSPALEKLCIIFSLGALSVDAVNGSSALSAAAGDPSTCCGSVLGGTCADGSHGTPCCGKGKCNAFCCACDDGCRAAPSPNPPTPIPPSASSTPLNQWPMITSHDAATTYYAQKTCTLVKAVENYVMTQVPGSFTTQLDCGARAFDLRPKNVKGKLVAHHGGVTVNVAIVDILNEIVQWSKKNPNEFVLVYGSHCDGDNCAQMFSQALSSVKISSIQCSEIAGLTLGSAMQRGRLPNGGGSILAVWGCVEQNYEPAISCYSGLHDNANLSVASAGSDTAKDSEEAASVGQPRNLWSCYGSDAQKAFDPLWAYMSKMTDGRGKKQGFLWMAQAHWQYGPSAIAQGELRLSCILQDESKSGVNQKLAQKISQGLFPHINLLEVDDVCGGHGPELLHALRSRCTYDIGLSDQAVLI